MPERPEPDLDHVRRAMREHDERQDDEEAPPAPEGGEERPEEDADEG